MNGPREPLQKLRGPFALVMLPGSAFSLSSGVFAGPAALLRGGLFGEPIDEIGQ